MTSDFRSGSLTARTWPIATSEPRPIAHMSTAPLRRPETNARMALDRLDRVRDEDVVPLVVAVAEDREGCLPPPERQEDRDHAAFEIGALSGTVDVREPQRDVRHLRGGDDLLGLELELAIVRWRLRVRALVGPVRCLAVERAARRDVHEHLDVA